MTLRNQSQYLNLAFRELGKIWMVWQVGYGEEADQPLGTNQTKKARRLQQRE